MRVAAVIPAMNEAPTIAGVAEAAKAANCVDEVVVVDAGSIDGTGDMARERGARVVRETARGKGQAMRAGVSATDAEIIVFLDGDLLGLRPDHVDDLVRPVLEGRAAMACGLFDRGPVLNPVFLRLLPILTGERALRRDLFDGLDPEDVRGYKVEAALNARCADLGLDRVAFVCDGMWHRTKEQKFANPIVGFVVKLAMLLTAVWGYASYGLRRRLLERLRRRVRGPAPAEI